MDSTSSVVCYGSSSTDNCSDSVDKSLQHASQPTHRVNDHAEPLRASSCAEFSLKPNTNNNSSSSLGHPPSTLSAVIPRTNSTNSVGVLQLVPSSSAKHAYVLDQMSQQKLLSLLAGYGSVPTSSTCSVSDGNVTVAVNDQLKMQGSCSSLVPQRVLFKSGDSLQREERLCDQVSSTSVQVGSVRGFGDTGEEGVQNVESCNTNPLMFLALAAEELNYGNETRKHNKEEREEKMKFIDSGERIDSLSSNEDRHEGEVRVGSLEMTETTHNLSTNNERQSSPVDQVRMRETSAARSSVSAKEGKEILHESVTRNECGVCPPTTTVEESTSSFASKDEDVCVYNESEEKAVLESHSNWQLKANRNHSLSDSVSPKEPSLNTHEQNDVVVQTEPPVLMEDGALPAVQDSHSETAANGDALVQEALPSIKQGETVESVNSSADAELHVVDEGSMKLLLKAIDLKDTCSGQLTSGGQDSMEYCMKTVVDSSLKNAHSANLAEVDKVKKNDHNLLESLSVDDVGMDRTAAKLNGREKGAVSADLVVASQRRPLGVNETSELELSSVVSNNVASNVYIRGKSAPSADIASLNVRTASKLHEVKASNVGSLEENAQSADSAVSSSELTSDMLSTPPCDETSTSGSSLEENAQSADLCAARQSVGMSKSRVSLHVRVPSPLSSDATDDAGPCPFSETSDESPTPQPGSSSFNVVRENESFALPEEQHTILDHDTCTSKFSRVSDPLSEAEGRECIASEDLCSDAEGKLDSIESLPPSSMNDCKQCMEERVVLSSSKNVGDEDVKHCTKLVETPLVVTVREPRALVSKCSVGEGRTLGDDLGIGVEQVKLSVNIPPTSVSKPITQNGTQFHAKVNIGEKDAEISPTATNARFAPILSPPSDLISSRTCTVQPQTSNSPSVCSRTTIDADQNNIICTNLKQHLSPVEDRVDHEDDASRPPCLQQGKGAVTTLTSPILSEHSMDKGSIEEISTPPIANETPLTIYLPGEESNATLSSTEPNLADDEGFVDSCGEERQHVPRNEENVLDVSAEEEEMDAQISADVHFTESTDTSQYNPQPPKSTIPSHVDVEAQADSFEAGSGCGQQKTNLSTGNQVNERVSEMTPNTESVESALPTDTGLEASERDGIGEVNSRSSVDRVVKSSRFLSVGSSKHLDLEEQPLHFEKEAALSDCADQTDSVRSICTKSTDTYWTECAVSANSLDPELRQHIPQFEENPQSDHDSGNSDGRNGKDPSTESTCPDTALLTAQLEPQTTACINSHVHVHVPCTNVHTSIEMLDSDVHLPPTELTTEMHNSLDDDRSSSTSSIITTSACYRRECYDTNSDSGSSAAGRLLRSSSNSLSDSFNSRDRCSLSDSIGSGGGAFCEDGSELVADTSCETQSISGRPTSLSMSSSFSKRKKSLDPGFYAASKVIMTRSKLADLKKIGDDVTVSQAFSAQFHDLSNGTSGEVFGLKSPAGECQSGRSMSTLSTESTNSSVCSLRGESGSGRSGRFVCTCMCVRLFKSMHKNIRISVCATILLSWFASDVLFDK